MSNFMVVYKAEDGHTYSLFYDTVEQAEQVHMDLECGMGYYSEVYSRVKEDGIEQYVFLFA